jgi:hypothetical protein
MTRGEGEPPCAARCTGAILFLGELANCNVVSLPRKKIKSKMKSRRMKRIRSKRKRKSTIT